MKIISLKNLLLLALAAGLIILAGIFLAWNSLQKNIIPSSAGYYYQIQAGDSLYSVSEALHKQGVLGSPKLLRLYARLSQQTDIRRGEYLLTADLNHIQLLQKLRSNDTRRYHITLLEGWTYQQALQYLHSKTTVQVRLKDKSWLQQKRLLKIAKDHPEGWFFPDTYSYQKGDSDVDIMRRAFTKLDSMLERQWQQRASALPYKNKYQALIMASIIEKETAVDREREQIAGVFVRRMNKGMRLQTDPTVIYGMGDSYKGNIRRKDLRTPTPYNTYRISGLPPTPIALVGERSIYAALHPDSGTSLYFVAKGDGAHKFSASLAEHESAVREYQINKRRRNYRSSPAPKNGSSNDK